MKISVNCVIKNEDFWVLYSILSVIEYVDEIIITDTGSTDHTLELINSIASPKIKFNKTVIQSPEEFTKIRQAQLDSSVGDWIMILDGDEIWTKESMENSVKLIIDGDIKVDYLINKYHNLVGDIYHRLPDSASKYNLRNRKGPFTIRFFNKNIEGLKWSNPYGSEGLFTSNDISIQDNDNLLFGNVDDPYLHCTHLQRSTQEGGVFMRDKKFKYEIGLKLEKNFQYPKSLYIPNSFKFLNPWKKISFMYLLRALLQTPFKRLNRVINHA